VNILSVIETLAHGGAETVLTNLVLSLPEHQHRILHFSSANQTIAHQPFLAELKEAGVNVFDKHWSALNEPAIRQEVNGESQPDVILFHWWGRDPWRSYLNRIDKRAAKRPRFVLIMHHAEIPAPAGYDQYVLVADFQRSQLSHIKTEKVVVIPNGIDLNRFKDMPVKGKNGFVIGRLSGLRPGKIPEDWVQKAINFQVPEATFIIAGEGDLRRILERDAQRLKVFDRFLFPGYIPVDQVPRLLSTFDVFCYATSTAIECCPLALLEALAAGVPIVAECRGGIPEIVVHNQNGLLANSPLEMGMHLRTLAADPDRLANLSRGAKISAQRFSLQRQIDAFRILLDRHSGMAKIRQPGPDVTCRLKESKRPNRAG
jgi:glycosyltransferase involved in cell wall biosynthesis